jgi:hypothetical protein
MRPFLAQSADVLFDLFGCPEPISTNVLVSREVTGCAFFILVAHRAAVDVILVGSIVLGKAVRRCA